MLAVVAVAAVARGEMVVQQGLLVLPVAPPVRLELAPLGVVAVQGGQIQVSQRALVELAGVVALSGQAEAIPRRFRALLQHKG